MLVITLHVILPIANNPLLTIHNTEAVCLVCRALYYPIDPTLQMLNPIVMYKEALITFGLSI